MQLSAKEVLQKIVDNKASDLHLTIGLPPMMRVSSNLSTVPGYAALDSTTIEEFVFQILNDVQEEKLKKEKEIDFSFSLGTKSRFRANAFYQKGFLLMHLLGHQHYPVQPVQLLVFGPLFP